MENRTPDLVIANDALYQLSYDPTKVGITYNPRPSGASAKTQGPSGTGRLMR